MLDERLHTVLLDLLLTVETEHLLDFQLYRQSMRIPAGLSRNHLSLHRLVARNHILDNTGQHMTDVWLSVCCRRSVIESICLTFFAVLHALFKNILFFPEFFYFFFVFNNISVGRYLIVHMLPPS